VVPDDARLRLQTLAAPPPSAGGPPRGWPAAPEGTPGARLGPDDGGGWGPGPDGGGGAPGPGDGGWAPGAAGGGWSPGPEDDGGGRAVPAARTGWSARSSPWDEPRTGLGRWLPASWLAARWDPGGWGAIGLAVVAALAAVVAAVGVWAGRPVAEPVPALPAVSAGPAAAPSGVLPAVAPAPGGPVVVNVAGKVRRPGLVTLREGARVGEALEGAGGALPGVDLTPLNLAARVVDGQQILVGVAAPAGPSPAAAPGPAGGAPAAGGAPGGKLDLNAATLEQLDGLPGVGPVTAKKILDWRTQNGRFSAVEQLREIPGIGDARFGTLRDLVRV
jgi:competence protein ComEA